ncbi:hypothetical protein SARC_07680 [Sphaeroforma arctica JP610]|uniref:Uncharacterized protein n=1 Tax=Sphaeroforma arctica JP610 TaxID=667725 RepID=A0A0L0FTD2_9EUKA|nr:hypothetical protein SARC_07680 [Sphaeroforma arctica JP610]KNC79944.1 hypothetical protein SARC_07680 [Sphaeroforma arctica JP610]|eukprot:XP_014153846.1 hypothetical protein SARC_07680 [Sphaeroforma arctica JP610]
MEKRPADGYGVTEMVSKRKKTYKAATPDWDAPMSFIAVKKDCKYCTGIVGCVVCCVKPMFVLPGRQIDISQFCPSPTMGLRELLTHLRDLHDDHIMHVTHPHQFETLPDKKKLLYMCLNTIPHFFVAEKKQKKGCPQCLLERTGDPKEFPLTAVPSQVSLTMPPNANATPSPNTMVSLYANQYDQAADPYRTQLNYTNTYSASLPGVPSPSTNPSAYQTGDRLTAPLPGSTMGIVNSGSSTNALGPTATGAKGHGLADFVTVMKGCRKCNNEGCASCAIQPMYDLPGRLVDPDEFLPPTLSTRKDFVSHIEGLKHPGVVRIRSVSHYEQLYAKRKLVYGCIRNVDHMFIAERKQKLGCRQCRHLNDTPNNDMDNNQMASEHKPTRDLNYISVKKPCRHCEDECDRCVVQPMFELAGRNLSHVPTIPAHVTTKAAAVAYLDSLEMAGEKCKRIRTVEQFEKLSEKRKVVYGCTADLKHFFIAERKQKKGCTQCTMNREIADLKQRSKNSSQGLGTAEPLMITSGSTSQIHLVIQPGYCTVACGCRFCGVNGCANCTVQPMYLLPGRNADEDMFAPPNLHRDEVVRNLERLIMESTNGVVRIANADQFKALPAKRKVLFGCTTDISHVFIAERKQRSGCTKCKALGLKAKPQVELLPGDGSTMLPTMDELGPTDAPSVGTGMLPAQIPLYGHPQPASYGQLRGAAVRPRVADGMDGVRRCVAALLGSRDTASASGLLLNDYSLTELHTVFNMYSAAHPRSRTFNEVLLKTIRTYSYEELRVFVGWDPPPTVIEQVLRAEKEKRVEREKAAKAGAAPKASDVETNARAGANEPAGDVTELGDVDKNKRVLVGRVGTFEIFGVPAEKDIFDAVIKALEMYHNATATPWFDKRYADFFVRCGLQRLWAQVVAGSKIKKPASKPPATLAGLTEPSEISLNTDINDAAVGESDQSAFVPNATADTAHSSNLSLNMDMEDVSVSANQIVGNTDDANPATNETAGDEIEDANGLAHLIIKQFGTLKQHNNQLTFEFNAQYSAALNSRSNVPSRYNYHTRRPQDTDKGKPDAQAQANPNDPDTGDALNGNTLPSINMCVDEEDTDEKVYTLPTLVQCLYADELSKRVVDAGGLCLWRSETDSGTESGTGGSQDNPVDVSGEIGADIRAQDANDVNADKNTDDKAVESGASKVQHGDACSPLTALLAMHQTRASVSVVFCPDATVGEWAEYAEQTFPAWFEVKTPSTIEELASVSLDTRKQGLILIPYNILEHLEAPKEGPGPGQENDRVGPADAVGAPSSAYVPDSGDDAINQQQSMDIGMGTDSDAAAHGRIAAAEAQSQAESALASLLGKLGEQLDFVVLDRLPSVPAKPEPLKVTVAIEEPMSLSLPEGPVPNTEVSINSTDLVIAPGAEAEYHVSADDALGASEGKKVDEDVQDPQHEHTMPAASEAAPETVAPVENGIHPGESDVNMGGNALNIVENGMDIGENGMTAGEGEMHAGDNGMMTGETGMAFDTRHLDVGVAPFAVLQNGDGSSGESAIHPHGLDVQGTPTVTVEGGMESGEGGTVGQYPHTLPHPNDTDPTGITTSPEIYVNKADSENANGGTVDQPHVEEAHMDVSAHEYNHTSSTDQTDAGEGPLVGQAQEHSQPPAQTMDKPVEDTQSQPQDAPVESLHQPLTAPLEHDPDHTLATSHEPLTAPTDTQPHAPLDAANGTQVEPQPDTQAEPPQSQPPLTLNLPTQLKVVERPSCRRALSVFVGGARDANAQVRVLSMGEVPAKVASVADLIAMVTNTSNENVIVPTASLQAAGGSSAAAGSGKAAAANSIGTSTEEGGMALEECLSLHRLLVERGWGFPLTFGESAAHRQLHIPERPKTDSTAEFLAAFNV